MELRTFLGSKPDRIELDYSGGDIRLATNLGPQLVLETNPDSDLNQSDILAYLTINQKVVEEGFDATRINEPVESYVGILVEKQLERYGKDLIGLDVVDLRMGGDIFQTIGSSDTTSTQLLLGQRLSKNLKVTYLGDLSSLSVGTQYDVGLEYQVNRNFSITSNIDENGLFKLRGRLKYSY